MMQTKQIDKPPARPRSRFVAQPAGQHQAAPPVGDIRTHSPAWQSAEMLNGGASALALANVQRMLNPGLEDEQWMGAPSRTLQPQTIEGLEGYEENLFAGGIGQMRRAGMLTGGASGEAFSVNRTGLPDRLLSGVEALARVDMSDVRVYANSQRPARLNAHAFAQGPQIHLAPGQQRHLPHEAWHVAQQKQGRVRPTGRVNGVAVNDNPSLEREADVMGMRALQMKPDRVAGRGRARGTGETRRARYMAATALQSHRIAQLIAVVQRVPEIGSVIQQRIWERYWEHPAPKPAMTYRNFFNVAHGLGILPARLTAVRAGYGGATEAAITTFIDNVYTGAYGGGNAIAGPGQFAADNVNAMRVRDVLLNQPYIQGVLAGNLHQAGPGALPINATLGVPGGAPEQVVAAQTMFQRLVTRAGLPAIGQVNHRIRPDSSMGRDRGAGGTGTLNLGSATPRGVALHELGHHLENSVDPEEFATLHNFLRARTRAGPGGVGFAPDRVTGLSLMLPQIVRNRMNPNTGYDTDMPAIDTPLTGQGTATSILRLLGDGVRLNTGFIPKAIGGAIADYGGRQVANAGAGLADLFTRYTGPLGRGVGALGGLAGNLLNTVGGYLSPLIDDEAGGRSIENFFIDANNNQTYNYSSMVYDDFGTEYISTTMEQLANPAAARELLNKDPLRLALFLYLANRPVYNAVRARLRQPTNSGAPGFDLNNLIHKIG